MRRNAAEPGSARSRRCSAAPVAATLLLAALVLVADGASAQDAPPAGSPASPPAAPPAGLAAADPAARRAERVAAERARLEREIAAIDAFGHLDDFSAAQRRLHDEAKGAKWWPLADSALPMVTVENWLAWNEPAAGATLPTALDLERDGHPFRAIASLAKQLNEHGIEFLFVTFPTRVQLDPALIVPGLATPLAAKEGAPAFRGMVAAQTRFLLELAKAGVEVLDLAPLFVEQRDGDPAQPRRAALYHRWNMHWSPRAIDLAAKATTERLAQMPWFRPGPYREGSAFRVQRREFDFTAEGNGQAPDSKPEPIAIDSVQPLGAVLTKETLKHGPIVLLGDSFAGFHREYSGSFQDQLFRFAGWPIDVIAPPGGGELQCRQELKRRGELLAEKKVVIWLMQEAALVPMADFRPIAIFGGR